MQTITLPYLEQLIRNRNAPFPPALAAAHERERENVLATCGRMFMLRSIIGYNLYLSLDFGLLPKTAWLATALHLAVITPLMIFGAILVRRDPRAFARSGIMAVVPLLITIQIMLIFRLNTGQNAWAYQFLAALVMVYANVSQPAGMTCAVLASAGIATIYAGALLTSAAPPAIRIIGCVLMLSAAYLSLRSKVTLERANRTQFLLHQCECLRRREAEKFASRDALTGLSNRRHLDERIHAIWSAPGPAAQNAAIVMIDIDHFKLFNDHYGHPAGDHCLRRVAGAIASVLRGQEDIAVRFGGEEFVLLLPETSLETAIQIAERVRRAIESLSIPHEVSPTGRCVTASLGAAAAAPRQHAAALIAEADQALYKAKHAGRNQVHPPFMTLEPKPAKIRRSAV